MYIQIAQKLYQFRGVCHLHKARLNTFCSDRLCLSGILPFPIFFLQVSFKGNYTELEDMSKTVVGRYFYCSQFENESYKRLDNNQINSCTPIGQSGIICVPTLNLWAIA